MDDKFFALIGRLRYIDRWSLMRNTRKENVAEHSYMTAIVAHALCVIANESFGEHLDANLAAVLALYHEAAEVFTGDLPTPVKYYGEEIRSAYKTVEHIAERKLLGYLPPSLRPSFEGCVSPQDVPERRYVKYADKIAALIKCDEESAAGNPEFAAARASALETLHGYGVPAVDTFLETFVPAFGLTLDETL